MRRAVLAVIGTLAVAGCGGDDAPSRDEFAADAEKICADLEKQSDRLSETQPENNADIVKFTQDARKTAEDAVTRIGELEVPEGEDGEKAQQWQNAVEREANDELIPALEDLEKAAEDEDNEGILAAAQKLQGLESTESDRLAKEIGAEGCSG